MDSLVGITFDKWRELLRQNSRLIPPQYWGKQLTVTAKSLFNSKVANLEKLEWGENIEQTQFIKSPIFILGHWRSGTTMLQNYLSLDPQFATPRLADVLYPNSLVRYHHRHNGSLQQSQAAKKRPMDNVEVHLNSPAEDEFALAVMTLYSPLYSWVFPNNCGRYDKYLTFAGAKTQEIEAWGQTFIYYLKKITLTYKKQILLKSPQHTARVPLLLKFFPDAKFVHIHRHPYDLFQSTRKLYKTAIYTSSMQRVPAEETWPERIVSIYNEMYDSFFEHKDGFAKGTFIDIGFEEFEEKPLQSIRRIYETLGLDNFETFLPILKEKTEQDFHYQKNKYKELAAHEKELIYNHLKRSFDYWDYSR